MTDDKNKPKLGSANIIPPDKNNLPETETAEDFGGSPPNVIEGVEYKVGQPPQPPARTTTTTPAYPKKPSRPALGEGKQYRVTLPDGKWITASSETEAKQIAQHAYGRNYPTHAIFEILQPQAQTQTEIVSALARTKTRTLPLIKTEPPRYLPEDQKRIKLLESVSKILPEDEEAQADLNEVISEAQKTKQEQHGPIPTKDIPAIGKMYGELKKYIYEGYADYFARIRKEMRHKALSGQEEAAYLAERSQESQLVALRYGMSVLSNLHEGLDLASWSFFFNSLGPLGEILETIHYGEIDWKMKYYGGRAWWSPYRVDYLIKTLPEEKTVDLILDVTKQTLYLVSKATNIPLFVKEYDRYGRPLSRGPVFAPLVKFQKGVNKIADSLEALGTEIPILQLQKQLEQINEQLFLEQSKKNPSKSALDELTKLKKTTASRIGSHEKYFHKQWIKPYLSLFSKNKTDRRIALDAVRAGFFKAVFPKAFLRKIKEPKRDIVTWFAVLIANYLFEITIGNIVRLVAEKVTSSATWLKVSSFLENSKALKILRVGANTAQELLKAGLSFNTASGTYLGYVYGGALGENIARLLGADPETGTVIGQVIGTPIGILTGWTYQWVLNMSQNQTIMKWVNNYNSLTNEIILKTRIYNRLLTKVGIDHPVSQEYLSDLKKLSTQHFNLAGKFTQPGVFTRFASWLNSPLGKFFRPPLNGLAVSSIIEYMQAGGLIMPEWYQWWMPPVIQYLWAIKGNLLQLFSQLTGNGFVQLWKFSAFDLKTVETLRYNEAQFANLRATIGVEGRGIIQYRTIVQGGLGGEVRYVVQVGKFNSLFTQLNQAYLRYAQSPINALQKISGTFSRSAWLKNFFNPGFFIGLEIAYLLGLPLWAYPLAALSGSMAFTIAARGAWNILGGKLVGGFGQFLNKVSFGGFVGWAVGTIIEAAFGIPYAGLIGTLVGSVAIIAIPTILTMLQGMGFGFATTLLGLGGSLGATLTAFLGGIGISITFAGAMAFLVVGSVITLTVLTVIILASAFWVPFSETLEGITANSQCFSINQPTINNQIFPAFRKDQKNKICWRSEIKNEFFPSAITKTKTLNPWHDFKVGDHSVTITLPGKEPFELESGKTVSGYRLDYLVRNTPLGSNPLGGNQEYVFTITPPKDKGTFKNSVVQKLNGIAQRIQHGGVINYTKNTNILIAEAGLRYIYTQGQKTLVYDKELALLNSLEGKTEAEVATLVKDAKEKALAEIAAYEVKNQIETRTLATFSEYESRINPILQECKTGQSFCNNINQLNSLEGYKNEVTSRFDRIIFLPASERQNRVSQLKEAIKTIEGDSPSLTKENFRTIEEIANTLHSYGPGEQLDKKIDDLANTLTQGQTMYQIPNGTLIDVCLLDVEYEGASPANASTTERDAASLPFTSTLGPLEPLTVPSCQASLTTPLINGEVGQLLSPVGSSCSISQGYEPGKHNGIDFAGGMGTNIYAVRGGTVISDLTKSYESNSFGNYLVVKGDDGLYYLYAHLGSRTDSRVPVYANGLKQGSVIKAGQTIGYMGNTGKSTGPHLHFAVSTSPDTNSFYNSLQSPTIDPTDYIVGCN